jgi:hypothetical protein
VDDGRVRDEAVGQVFAWEGFPMVLPASESLEERVFSPAYEARVAEELPALCFSLTSDGGGHDSREEA